VFRSLDVDDKFGETSLGLHQRLRSLNFFFHFSWYSLALIQSDRSELLWGGGFDILRKEEGANAISKSRTGEKETCTYTMKVIKAVSIMSYYNSGPACEEYCKEKKRKG
jgi:hypothetical protein